MRGVTWAKVDSIEPTIVRVRRGIEILRRLEKLRLDNAPVEPYAETELGFFYALVKYLNYALS